MHFEHEISQFDSFVSNIDCVMEVLSSRVIQVNYALIIFLSSSKRSSTAKGKSHIYIYICMYIHKYVDSSSLKTKGKLT